MTKKNILAGLSLFSIGFLVLAGSVVAQTSLRYTQDVYLGMKNSQVSQLQEDLAKNSALYPEKLVTGYFGQLTLRAVKNFQAKYGIRQTGYVGPLTRTKLNQLFPSSTVSSDGKVWGCRSVTQGIPPDPNNPPPVVCGYIPTCSSEQNLVATLDEGTWPDGSRKGIFICSSDLPPSVPR